MSEANAVLSPNKAANTTTPRNTFMDISHSVGGGMLLYRPEDNSFIALYPEEWRECRAEAHENNRAIEELQEANRIVTEKSLILQELLRQPISARPEVERAQKDLDVALNLLEQKSDAAKKRVEAIVDQKTDPSKLVELLPLTLTKAEKKYAPIYVKAEKLRSALVDKRVHFVQGAAERKKRSGDKLFNGVVLNVKEVRNRIADTVQDKAKFEKKWKLAPQDADKYSGILSDWAKVMGAEATQFLEREQQEIIDGVFSPAGRNPDNPYRNIDLKPEAQFLRWAAGAGAEANFMFLQGNLFDRRDKNWQSRLKRAAKSVQFGFKANAEASFAIGEAKVETTLYLPHAAGWHMNAVAIGQPFDFGYFRLRGDLSLYALAGASLALETSASLLMNAGKIGLRGTPRRSRGVKTKVGAKGEAAIFAGLKEGVALKGAVQWLNPEGMIDPSVPKKASPTEAIAEYVDVASAEVDASLIQGLAADLGFQCEYRRGQFVIAAKAGACFGLGGSGNVAATVGVDQIGQFFMCMAHQLKQADYKKMTDLMDKTTFDVFNKILYLVVAQGQRLETYIGQAERRISETYEEMTNSIQENGEKFIRELQRRMQTGWGWYAYMPPESRAALIQTVGNITLRSQLASNGDLRDRAAFAVNELIATTQSSGHLANTLDRVSLAMGEVTGRSNGVQVINSIVKGTAFSDCLARTEMQLSNACPLMGRPFLRNDEGNFLAAQLPLHHSAYNA